MELVMLHTWYTTCLGTSKWPKKLLMVRRSQLPGFPYMVVSLNRGAPM